jgi:sugar-specific transcriptional regulator TrmB
MDKMLVELLEKVGLSKLEAEVYLYTLTSKKKTAYAISQHLKTRTSVYSTLDSLRKKGLVAAIMQKNKKVYEAKDISSFVNERRDESAIVYKNILTFSSHLLSNKATTIKIFKGEEDLKEGLRYGVTKNEASLLSPIYCVYPSSSKMTISPKDTIYYNFNVALKDYGYTKLILSDTSVKKEYEHLDKELGFTRIKKDTQILFDLSNLSIGIEVIESSGVIKIFFYKETLILSIENKELSSFLVFYLKSLF